MSFSEAIAIAATDATGSQTIVFDSSLANQTVSTSSASSLGESITVDLDAASGVTLSGGTLSIGSGFDLTVTNGTSDTATIATGLSGAGNLIKTGVGKVTLSGINSFAGKTTVAGGTLAISSDSNLGSDAVVLNAGVTLQVTGSTAVDNAFTLAGNSAVQTDANASFSGLLSGGAVTLTKTGTAQLTLSNSGNSGAFSGGVTVSSGALRVTSDSMLSAGTLTLDGGSFASNTNGLNIDNAVVLGSSGGTFDIFGGGGAFVITFSGNITGSGALTKISASQLSLTGTNTYSGGTTVSAGTLRIGGASNLGTGTVTLNSGTLDDTNASTETITNNFTIGSGGATFSKGTGTLTLSGTLSGSGSVTNTGVGGLNHTGSGTLTLDGTSVTRAASAGAITLSSNIVVGNSGATFDTTGGDITLKGDFSGSGNLTKQGGSSGAILWLYGDNSAYSGAQTVASGWLVANSATALGSGQITLDASTTLGLLGGITTFSNNIVLAGDATLPGADTTNTVTTFSGVISETGGSRNLTLGTGTGSNTGIILTGANTWTGTTTISGSNVLQDHRCQQHQHRENHARRGHPAGQRQRRHAGQRHRPYGWGDDQQRPCRHAVRRHLGQPEFHQGRRRHAGADEHRNLHGLHHRQRRHPAGGRHPRRDLECHRCVRRHAGRHRQRVRQRFHAHAERAERRYPVAGRQRRRHAHRQRQPFAGLRQHARGRHRRHHGWHAIQPGHRQRRHHQLGRHAGRHPQLYRGQAGQLPAHRQRWQ